MRFETAQNTPPVAPEIFVPCSIECSSDLLPAGTLLKLGPTSGLLYIPRHFGATPERLLVHFSLPGNERTVDLETAVLQSSHPDPEGVWLLIGFTPDDTRHAGISRFLTERMMDVAAEVVQKGSLLADVTRGRLVSDEELSLLRATLAHAQAAELFDPATYKYVPGTIQAEGEEGFLVIRGAPLDLQMSTWLHVSWRQGEHLNHVYVQLVARRGEKLVCGPAALICCYPSVAGTSPQPRLKVVVPLPFPAGKTLTREVVEINERGLSFHVGVDEPYFMPGTPLFELAVVDPSTDETLHRPAHVYELQPQQDTKGQLSHLLVRVHFDLGAAGYTKGHRGTTKKARKPRLTLLQRMGLLLQALKPKPKAKEAAFAFAPALGAPEQIDVVRYMNAQQQWLVGVLNMTRPSTAGPLSAPVVVIPPAFGRRKESTGAIALTIVESFARAGQDVVVLRYDGVHGLGESYKDPDCRDRERESLRMTLSQSVEDIHTTLDYVYDNPRFSPTQVILLSFSLQGVAGRRAVFEDRGRRIHKWMGIMGAPAAREIVRNVSGGVDYIANFASGKRVGVASILGVPMDCDRFCRDALDNRLAFLADAKMEVAEIPIPITWISGEHDAWVDPTSVDEFLAVETEAPRHHVMLPTGHTPLNAEEALDLSSEIVHHISRFLFGAPIPAVPPDWQTLLRARRSEWARAPKAKAPDRQNYWRDYLLGESEDKLGYDVIARTEEYQAFIDRQVKLLNPRPHEVIADMGCGTGNLSLALCRTFARRRGGACQQLVTVDFVDKALEETRRKVDAFAAENPAATLPAIETHCVDLELDPAVTIRRFLQGDLPDLTPLKGAFQNLTDYSLDLWRNAPGWRLSTLLRGSDVREEDRAILTRQIGPEELAIVLDMNRIARVLKGRPRAGDLSEEGLRRRAAGEVLGIPDLALTTLVPRRTVGQERLPFESEFFDAIACSIVVSYLDNPLETLTEYYRCLKPGGRIVVSSMQPDADMSKVYMNLLRRVEAGRPVDIPAGMSRERFLEEVREYANAAAFLFTLAEEGLFSFFSAHELNDLVERAGFTRTKSHLSFGAPPLAHITIAQKPMDAV